MAQVDISNLRKSYGPVDVLHGIDISVRDGEFLVLVGPSGCGKSTLLRMIAGLEEITSGTISIGGRVVNDVSPKERDIAMVFQNYALYPHMTVRQNMAFSLKLRGEATGTTDKLVNEAAEILGLTPYLERYPKQLSGGQRQRVAMGRAIVRKPQVFLFDEPLSNLDAKLRVQMRGEIRTLQQRLSTTAIYVTHDQVEALTMADRIVVMRDGRIDQIGTPTDLYDRPANVHVAGFIGSPAMNFIEGTLQRTSSEMHVVTTSNLRLPLPNTRVGVNGTRVVYGIRPEHISVAAGGAITAEVVSVELSGAFTSIAARANGFDFIVQTTERCSKMRGEFITLSPNVELAHVFDAASGIAL